MKRQRVLITGAAGRIGSLLAQHWRDSHELVLIDKHAPTTAAPAPFLQCDLSDQDSLPPLFEGIDTVIHLAADPNPNASWQSLLPNNIEATHNVLEAAAGADCHRAILASSLNAVAGYPADAVDTTGAGDLYAAGVRRVNISLDTLDEDKFAQITRWGRLPQVLRGIDAAQTAGLRVKINTVALANFNDVELFELQAWCASRDMDLTFIEVMPMGDIGNEDRITQYWSLKDLRTQLAERFTVTDLAERTGGPARYIRLEETGQKIGLITPLSHNFCESCNRVRITCTGEIYMCLGQEDMADLRAPLRAHPDDDAPLEDAIRAAIALKPKGHDFDYSRQRADGQMSRHMSHTGG